MGKCSPVDQRYLYAPWSNGDTPNVNLDAEWHYYFDDKQVYDRVRAIKLRFDPTHIFSPNIFCVGFNDKLQKEICVDTIPHEVNVEIESKSHLCLGCCSWCRI